MILGITGTRSGMNDLQREIVHSWLVRLGPPEMLEVHFGDCLGVDAEVFDMCRQMFPNGSVLLIGHPPADDSCRAYREYDEEMPRYPYLIRNQHIVNASNMLIACPAEMKEQSRGGTWYTVRYARRAKKRMVIVFPDGSVAEEN